MIWFIWEQPWVKKSGRYLSQDWRCLSGPNSISSWIYAGSTWANGVLSTWKCKPRKCCWYRNSWRQSHLTHVPTMTKFTSWRTFTAQCTDMAMQQKWWIKVCVGAPWRTGCQGSSWFRWLRDVGGPTATRDECEVFRQKLKSQPEVFVAQPTWHWVLVNTSWRGIAPRHVDLRPFVWWSQHQGSTRGIDTSCTSRWVTGGQ